MSSEAKPIAQVLVDVSHDVGAVKKESTNKFSGYNFRGIDAVMNAVWPALCKHGVFMQPEVLEIHFSTVPTKQDRVTNVVRLKFQVTFHGPAGDSISVVVWGEAADTGDKAVAKAHSVALRTALLQALCLPTDERDPDADTYEVQPHQEQQGPTEQQIQHFQRLSANLREVQNVEQLRAIINEAEAVPCLEPMRDQLLQTMGAIIPAVWDKHSLQAMWKLAEKAGILEQLKPVIGQQVKTIDAQNAQDVEPNPAGVNDGPQQ